MSHRTRHATGPELVKKGITHVIEEAPVPGDFYIKGVGAQLAVLFREELMRRHVARTRAQQERRQ